MEELELPKLNPDDYLTKGYEFWKKYRETLTLILKQEEVKLEKTPKNIVKMSNKSGIKPTSRYFNISPSQVRYYRKKIN